MNVNANYEGTTSTAYSAKFTIGLNEAQEKKLSGKDITNAYLVSYQKQAMEESRSTFSGQANTFRLSDIGYNGKPIGELSQSEASTLVSEDGFFGVTQTSERISNFVIGGGGDDLSKLQAGRSGMLQGFAEAEKMWGGKLPEISYATMQKALEKVDARIAELGGSVLDTSG